MATDYWKKREDDWIEECEKDHEKYLKEIKAIYQRMYDELEEQVELFYQRYAENEGITMQEARKRLTNAEMEKLSRKAKEYCELAALDMRNQNRANEAVYFSEEANAEMAKYNATMRINRLEMLKQYVALSAMKAQANVAGVTREALTEEAMKQHKRLAGILGNTVAGIEGKAKAIAEASFHGQKYSERIWGKNQDELIKRLNKIITDAIIQGKNPDTAIKKMAKDFKVTKQQAKRLVETELQRVKATVYKNQYKESEFDAYEYHAYAGCCKECQKLDGTKHPLKDLQPGYTAPPMHPNCRCSTTPAVDMSFTEKYSDKDVDEFDKWCDYMEKHEDDPNAMTWKEWKEKKQRISDLLLPKNNNRKLVHLEPTSVDISNFEFDDAHINNERKHQVSYEEAVAFMHNAKFLLVKQGGRFYNYYSDEGAVYLDMINMTISTAFKSHEFTSNVKEALRIYDE